MSKLIAISGPTKGREYPVGERCIFGRSSGCQVYIGDLMVSRQHARITQTADGFLLEDLSSGNGTFLNDERVIRSLLSNGDRIQVGDSTYRFVEESAAPSRTGWVNMATVLSTGTELAFVDVKADSRLELPSLVDVESSEEDLRADLSKAKRMLETLYAVTDATSSILEPGKLFAQILDYLFRVFPDAERGFVMVLDESGQLLPGAVKRRGSGGSGGASGFTGGLAISQTVVNQVISKGSAVLTAETPRTDLPASSKISAPLAAGGQTLGVLHIEGREAGAPFTKEDLELLRGIALQAGGAILNASLHEQLMSQQRLEQDLRFARQVQTSFLPTEPPSVEGYRFAFQYIPFFDVGGDFYDFIPLPDGRIGILIGDVSGKGVSAALMMARLTSHVRYLAITELSPARVLAKANATLLSTAQDNMFATVLYMVLDPTVHHLTISNAGHIPPLLRMAQDRSLLEIDEATSLALGVLPDPGYDQITVEIAEGDTVFLCTDGVVEAKNHLEEEYGFERLHRAIQSAPDGELLAHVQRDLQHHTRSTPQYDDISVVELTRIA
jgi:phosphoserine phosphatase RsbU/P